MRQIYLISFYAVHSSNHKFADKKIVAVATLNEKRTPFGVLFVG